MIETLTNLYVCGSCFVVIAACLVWVVGAVSGVNATEYRTVVWLSSNGNEHCRTATLMERLHMFTEDNSPLLWPSVVLAAIISGFGLWVLICGWPY